MKYLVVHIGLAEILLLIILLNFYHIFEGGTFIFLANNSSLLWYWKLNQIITEG